MCVGVVCVSGSVCADLSALYVCVYVYSEGCSPMLYRMNLNNEAIYRIN